MAYKSLFSVLTDDALIAPVLAQATCLAEAQDAHLDVLCLGVDRSQTGYYYAGANAMILQESIERAQSEAAAIETAVKAKLGVSGVRYGTNLAWRSWPMWPGTWRRVRDLPIWLCCRAPMATIAAPN